jgi:hypothetical protein
MSTSSRKRGAALCATALVAGFLGMVAPWQDADGRPPPPRPPPPRASVNRNVHVNQNVHVHRSVHVDVDRGYPGYHPVARTAAVVATAAVVGSIVYSLPPACTNVVVNGLTYHQCGSSWYQPRYSGTQVTYVVVNPPG